MHARTLSISRTLTHTQSLTFILSHTHTHKHTCTHKYTHTHTHTEWTQVLSAVIHESITVVEPLPNECGVLAVRVTLGEGQVGGPTRGGAGDGPLLGRVLLGQT